MDGNTLREKFTLRIFLGIILFSLLIITSGCVNKEGNSPSKDVHLIEAKMSMFPDYLTPNSRVSLKLELKNTGYGSVYIPYEKLLPQPNKKVNEANIHGPCGIESVEIFPPPQGKKEIELKEQQNKLFTWIIEYNGSKVGPMDNKCTLAIKIPYRGKVTYVRYIGVVDEKEGLEEKSLYQNFRGEEIKDEHSNVDVSIHLLEPEPIIMTEEEKGKGKKIKFQIILRNKGDATATIQYSKEIKDIEIKPDENLQNVECNIDESIKEIKIPPQSQRIIECSTSIKKPPKIAEKYRIQVDVTYHYNFKRDVSIPVYTNKDVAPTANIISQYIHIGYYGDDPLGRIVAATTQASLQAVLPAVVSDILDISSREMSEALQTYMKMQFGRTSGIEEADRWVRKDGRRIAEIIFDGKGIESNGKKCDKTTFKNLDIGCSKEEIKNALIETGCKDVIIENRMNYWSKAIDKVFDQNKEEITERIREGVREGILSNGNVITDAYRDKIIDDLRVKLGGDVYLHLNLNRVVETIIEKQLIEGLVAKLTSSPIEEAYLNYRIGFKSSFLEEYKNNIIDAVATYGSSMCLRKEGIWEKE